MNIPDTVKMGPYIYEVIWKDRLFNEDGELNGLCDRGACKIFLSDAIKESRQNVEETFLHECIHGIEHAINLQLTEEQVTRLATGLYAFLIDNGYIKVGKPFTRAKERKNSSSSNTSTFTQTG